MGNSDTARVFPRDFSDGQRTWFWQSFSALVAGLYFKDIFQLLNKCNFGSTTFPSRTQTATLSSNTLLLFFLQFFVCFV